MIQPLGVLVPGLAAYAANRDDKSRKQFRIPIWRRTEIYGFLNDVSSIVFPKPDSSGRDHGIHADTFPVARPLGAERQGHGLPDQVRQ